MGSPRDDSRGFSSMDKISELPDHVLHNVLSFLSTKQVFQTSVLSKRWSHALETFPILDFNQAYFGKALPQNRWKTLRKKDFATVREAMDNFMQFVDDSLERLVNKKLIMKSFKVFMTILDDHSVSALDKWITLAVNNQVEDLDLSLGLSPLKYYKVPQIMYRASSLKALSLYGCKLEYHANIKFTSLRKLSVDNVQLDDDRTLNYFFDCCPDIEDLAIRHICSSVECLQISRLRYLRRVYLWRVGITDQNFHDMIANSAKLERLDVWFCNKLERIKISSTQVQLFELVIRGCKKLEEVEVHAPKLRTFSLHGRKPLSSFTLSSPLCYTYANLSFDCDFPFDEWINFLSSSVECKRVDLSLKLSSPEITLKRLGKVSLPAFWRIKELELDVIAPPSNYSAIFTSLLVSCKPELLCAWTGPDLRRTNFTKYLYWRLKKGEEDCSKPCHVKCWRHLLKDMKLAGCIGSPCSCDNLPGFCSKHESYGLFLFQLQWRSNETASPSKCEQRVAESGKNDSNVTELTTLSQNLADANSGISSDNCQRVAESGKNDSYVTGLTALSQNLSDENSVTSSDNCQRVAENANDNSLTASLPIPPRGQPEPHNLKEEPLPTWQEHHKEDRADVCVCFRFMSNFPFLKLLRRWTSAGGRQGLVNCDTQMKQ